MVVLSVVCLCCWWTLLLMICSVPNESSYPNNHCALYRTASLFRCFDSCCQSDFSARRNRFVGWVARCFGLRDVLWEFHCASSRLFAGVGARLSRRPRRSDYYYSSLSKLLGWRSFSIFHPLISKSLSIVQYCYYSQYCSCVCTVHCTYSKTEGTPFDNPIKSTICAYSTYCRNLEYLAKILGHLANELCSKTV